MNQQISIQHAKSPDDLQQILSLQNQNHKLNLSDEARAANGFVTVRHDIQVLTKMNDVTKQVVAKSDNEVIAYALVMFKESSKDVPALIPMFEMFQQLFYKNERLETYQYYVMGQLKTLN